MKILRMPARHDILRWRDSWLDSSLTFYTRETRTTHMFKTDKAQIVTVLLSYACGPAAATVDIQGQVQAGLDHGQNQTFSRAVAT
jgi:hypothetical protein